MEPVSLIAPGHQVLQLVREVSLINMTRSLYHVPDLICCCTYMQVSHVSVHLLQLMVQLPHALEQPELVQTFITIATVVTTEMEVAMLGVSHLETGLQKHQLARKVCKLHI